MKPFELLMEWTKGHLAVNELTLQFDDAWAVPWRISVFSGKSSIVARGDTLDDAALIIMAALKEAKVME